MYKKVIFAGVLVAFICVQYASSLTCYQCSTPNDCKKPSKVTCTNANANHTSDQLGAYHQNVPNVTSSSRFDCLKIVYTYANNNTITSQIHGCVHPNANACSLNLKPTYSGLGWTKRQCNICSGNKCNKSPAGTYSSSLYTILGTTMIVILSKIYA